LSLRAGVFLYEGTAHGCHFHNVPQGRGRQTTTATVLSTILAERGRKVILIDADPNEAVMRWAGRKGGVPPNLTVLQVAGEQEFVRQLDDVAGRADYVVLDLEGRASRIVGTRRRFPTSS
jgi:chromosome partitioning protein